MARTHKGLPIRRFATRRSFEGWVEKNHAKVDDGLWVEIAKKASGYESVSYEEAREVALIYGWIDGLKNAIDADYYAIRFTPRRPRSKWSKINRDIVETLIADGKMHAAGLAEVEVARADGRWDAAYLGQATAQPPADFMEALAKSARAQRAWPDLKASSRFQVINQILDAKRETTRARRIAKFITMLENDELP